MGNCHCQDDAVNIADDLGDARATPIKEQTVQFRELTSPLPDASPVKLFKDDNEDEGEVVVSDKLDEEDRCKDDMREADDNDKRDDEDRCKDDVCHVGSTLTAIQEVEEVEPNETAVHTVHDKMARLTSKPGFFVAFDQRCKKALRKQDSSIDVKALHQRFVSNARFESSQVLGAFLTRDAIKRRDGQFDFVTYLEKEKNIVSFLDVENSLMPVNKGVQLIEWSQAFEESLELAVDHEFFGVKFHSIVNGPNTAGIAALVTQQFQIAKRLLAKGLLPVLHIAVDIKASDKSDIAREKASTERRKSEEMLFDQLLAALCNLQPGQRVMLDLMLPSKANTYLSLVGHPNTVRVLATTTSINLDNACQTLEDNFSLVAAFGGALMEGICTAKSDSDFTSALDVAFRKVFQASTAVPTKEMQTTKVHHAAGFFSCLDSTAKDIDTALTRYRMGSRSDFPSDKEAMDKLHEMRARIWSNPQFSGSRVIGVMMSMDTMQRYIEHSPTAKYLWIEKQIVPFLKIEVGLHAEKDGVQLMKDIPKLDTVLSEAVAAGIYGIRACSIIKKPDAKGIQAAVSQHLSLSMKIMKKDLVPVWHVEVDKDATDKVACEELLLDIMGCTLGHLRPEQKVILWVSPPGRANLYLPLRGHPNVIRIVFWDKGSNDRVESCRLLQQNYGVIGGFNRAFVQGMHSEQTLQELSDLVDASSQAIFESSRNVPEKTVQKYKISQQGGFFVALAQIAAKTESMFERVVTNPQFNSLHVIGVSLTPEQLNKHVRGYAIAEYLWVEKDIISFLRIDSKGLARERNGVQLMQEFPQKHHDTLLDMAVSAGVLGTMALSKIRRLDPKGIRELVEQQVKWAKLAMAKSLVPVLMIFIDREQVDEIEKCETFLYQTLLHALDSLDMKEEEGVVLNFVLPKKSGVYDPFQKHPKVLRVLASDENDSFDDSCRLLSQNVGLVGHIGTAIVEKLNGNQTYTEFTGTLGWACARFHQPAREDIPFLPPMSPRTPKTPKASKESKAKIKT